MRAYDAWSGRGLGKEFRCSCLSFYRPWIRELVQVAEAFAEEADIQLPQSALALFQDMYNIVSSLQQHDLDPALEWELSHRSKLPQSMLGFHLRRYSTLNRATYVLGRLMECVVFVCVCVPRMKFIQILCNEGQQAALSYIREHLSSLPIGHLPELKRLMGCIVYAPNISSSPYSDLVSADMWNDVQREFVRECTSILDHCSESPLSVTLLAGCAAMPQMVKLASTLKATKGKFPINGLLKSLPLSGNSMLYPYIWPLYYLHRGGLD